MTMMSTVGKGTVRDTGPVLNSNMLYNVTLYNRLYDKTFGILLLIPIYYMLYNPTISKQTRTF